MDLHLEMEGGGRGGKEGTAGGGGGGVIDSGAKNSAIPQRFYAFLSTLNVNNMSTINIPPLVDF